MAAARSRTKRKPEERGGGHRPLPAAAALLSLLVLSFLLLRTPPVHGASETGGAQSYGVSVSIRCSLSRPEGIVAGEDTVMKLRFENEGEAAMADAEIRLILPEEIQIRSGASVAEAGYFSVGGSKSAEFHLTAEKKTKAKSYPVEVQISGTDQTGSTRTVSRIFYLPVTGTDEEGAWSMKDIQITALSLPAQAESGENLELSFTVRNNGTAEARGLKITAEPGEGLLNRTAGVFQEAALGPGEAKTYRVSLFSLKDAAEKNYPVKVTVEPSSPKEGEDGTPVTQYGGVLLIPAEETDGVKTPRILLENYSFGGSSVQAGDTFPLELLLYNTSGRELSNIQVTVTSADGSFVPAGTGNTFFVERIGAKERVPHTLPMSVKNDAEEKTAGLEVEIAYEDSRGNEFTAKSAISVPVSQDTRLVVGDVVAPPEIYAGSQSGVSVDFYNMGKSVLNNLRVNVAGNFEEPQSNAYYAGNMEPGKSDSYDFSFIPAGGSPMEGRITFTYEDASGNERTVEKAFSFAVTEELPWEDPGMEEPPAEEPGSPWRKAGLYGGAAAAAVCLGVFLRRRHRRRKETALELED